jgi:cytochrome c peroxidase
MKLAMPPANLKFALAGLLLVTLCTAQGPLGNPPAPAQNPVTTAKAMLGKVLFYDEQLSSNGRMACGTCHLPEFGGGDARRRRHPGQDGVLNTADDTWGSPAVERRNSLGGYVDDPRFGFGEQVTSRAALSVHMAAWFPEQFWDGRTGGALVDPETQSVVIPDGAALEAQSLHPLRSEVEMAREGRSWAEIRQRLAVVRPLILASELPPDLQQALAANPTYPALFAAAFGSPTIDLPRIAMALASYQRTLVPNQTPWDLHAVGVPNALTADQLAGLQWYLNDAKCAECHPLTLGTDFQYRALGLVPVSQDPGRGAVTGLAEDFGRFKVPSVRNAALKSTFFHNGRFTTMAQVVNFYRNGGGTFTPKDALLQPFGLDQQQTAQLVDFLTNGLVDPRARLRQPPFDRPTLFSEVAPVGSNLFGAATGSLSVTPDLLAQMPAFLGNPEWSLGVARGPASGSGLLAFGLQSAPAGAALQGVQLNIDTSASLLLFGLALDAAGAGTLVLPVPMVPSLSGLPLLGQGFFATPTGGAWYGTRGAVVTLR